MRSNSCSLLVTLLVAVAACGESHESVDGVDGGIDAFSPSDGGSLDSGLFDASSTDAGSDAGLRPDLGACTVEGDTSIGVSVRTEAGFAENCAQSSFIAQFLSITDTPSINGVTIRVGTNSGDPGFDYTCAYEVSGVGTGIADDVGGVGALVHVESTPTSLLLYIDAVCDCAACPCGTALTFLAYDGIVAPTAVVAQEFTFMLGENECTGIGPSEVGLYDIDARFTASSVDPALASAREGQTVSFNSPYSFMALRGVRTHAAILVPAQTAAFAAWKRAFDG